jgi:hypothetical protein
MAMFSNLSLLIFSIFLAIVIKEMQTVVLTVLVGYTTVACYVHVRHIRKG